MRSRRGFDSALVMRVLAAVLLVVALVAAGSAALHSVGGQSPIDKVQQRIAAAVSQSQFLQWCIPPSGQPRRAAIAYEHPCLADEQPFFVVGTSNPPGVGTTTTTKPAVTTTTHSTPPTTTPTTLPGSNVGCPTADPPSTYSGVSITQQQAMQYAYAAGFTTVDELRTIVRIGIAESSLDVRVRNWHPSYANRGVVCRAASDVIGVQGPASVWNAAHTRQEHSDRGAWQISSFFWPQYSDAYVDNPATAAHAAHDIYVGGDGTGFAQWDTANSLGSQPTVQQVQSFIASQP